MFKDGGFKLHEKSEGYVSAMYAWREHKKAMITDSSIRNVMNEAYKRKVQENRKYIETVAEVLLLTATQNIAQRGHCKTQEEEFCNKGNFLAILEMIAKHDPVVQEKMMGRKNAKYTSSIIQNEVLECFANVVRNETKDLKKKEQLSLVLR